MVGAITWHRERGRVVIDLNSPSWHRYVDETDISASAAAEHVERAAAARRLRRLTRGAYVILEAGRPADLIAIASQLFEEHSHYVTTDAAFSHHAISEHPVRTYRVVVPSRIRRIRGGVLLDSASIRPVNLSDLLIASAAYSRTLTTASNRAVIAEPEQAMVDAFAQPDWTDQFDLLPEFLRSMTKRAVERAATLAISRSKAAAQRLGYALDLAEVPLPESLGRFTQAKGVQFNPRRRGARFVSRWSLYIPE